MVGALNRVPVWRCQARPQMAPVSVLVAMVVSVPVLSQAKVRMEPKSPTVSSTRVQATSGLAWQ